MATSWSVSAVQGGGDGESVDLDRRAGRGADADGLDVHAGDRSQPRHRHRVGLARVLPVGEQDDRRPSVVADVDLARVVLPSAVSLIFSVLPAMASSEVRMPCRQRRAASQGEAVDGPEHIGVGRASAAARSPALSRTRPPRCGPPAGCWWTNALAADFATAMREGLTSVAAMLFETSIARTTVAWRRSVVIVAIGRAMATTRRASAAVKSANGRWRRQLRRRPASVGDEALRGEAGCTSLRRRRCHRRRRRRRQG